MPDIYVTDLLMNATYRVGRGATPDDAWQRFLHDLWLLNRVRVVLHQKIARVPRLRFDGHLAQFLPNIDQFDAYHAWADAQSDQLT